MLTERTSAGRLFLGVALTDKARHAVHAHLLRERLPGRIVVPGDWHLTLRFLGETSSETIVELHEALSAADLGLRTEIAFGGLGAFPRPEGAKVLWLGVEEGAADLTAIRSRVEATARSVGFPAGDLSFTPHLTLSRPEPPVDVRGLIDRVPTLPERMAVNAVVLFRTHSGRSPGRYEEVARYPLRDPN